VVKKKVTRTKKIAKPEKSQKPEIKNDEDERFDFGGLPKMNLKKNLGCG